MQTRPLHRQAQTHQRMKTRGRKPSACASAKRFGMRAASLGATLLSLAGGWGMKEERTAPRESGASEARALPLPLNHRTPGTLARLRGRWSLLPCCLVPYCMVTAECDDKKERPLLAALVVLGWVSGVAPVAAQLGYFSSGSDRSCRGLRRGRRCSRPGPW